MEPWVIQTFILNSCIVVLFDFYKKDLLKPNYNAEKRRKELDRKKKKEEKELKKKLRREAIARGETVEDEEGENSEEEDDSPAEVAPENQS